MSESEKETPYNKDISVIGLLFFEYEKGLATGLGEVAKAIDASLWRTLR